MTELSIRETLGLLDSLLVPYLNFHIALVLDLKSFDLDILDLDEVAHNLMVDYLAGLGSDHLVGVQMTFLVMKLGLRGKHVAVLDVIDKELEEHLYYTLENHGSLPANISETKRVHSSLVQPVA